ncbi:MAG: peptide ABC transporter substrate-binding protein [Bdellovibrionales bacterium]|nr:peptide ABC transporter substrate-binding protein [Bdellovibrionales bacterium]
MKGLFLALFLSLCSCFFTKKQSFYTNYNLKESFRYPILSEPPTLDWNKSTDRASALIIQNIMEGLTEYDFSEKEPQVKAALAKNWTNSKDNKVWTFFIKDNVFWTDGERLTAKHFLSSWERLLNPKTASEYAYFLFPIKKARKYNQGIIKDFKEVGVKIGKQGELIVELEKALFYFPYLLTHTSTFPIRTDVIEKKKALWTEAENIVTLGPYKLYKWEHDKALVLIKNDSYYGKAPSIKNIIFYIIPEETTIMNLYQSGRLDVATPLISRDLPFLTKRKDHYFHNILSLYYYGFNLKAPNLKNKKVRQAIIHAIDRKEIVQLLNRGNPISTSFLPQGLFAYNPKIGLNFDPEKARKLLKEIPPQSLPSKIQIFYNTTSDHKMIAENIQSQLKKNINLNIELNNQEWKTYLQRLKAKQVEIFRLGWLADYPDPDNFMNLMASFSENNHTGWKNERYDSLILKAMVMKNTNLRKKLYDQAQKILLEEEAVVFPIFTDVSHILISPRIKNYPLNVMSYILFKHIEVKQ